MDGSNRLENIEKKLDNHGNTLCDIKTTLNDLAIQNERISSIQKQLANIWEKYDELVSPLNGVITKVTNFQASCPKQSILTHVKWLWGMVVSFTISQIAIAVRLLQ